MRPALYASSSSFRFSISACLALPASVSLFLILFFTGSSCTGTVFMSSSSAMALSFVVKASCAESRKPLEFYTSV